MQTLGQTVQTIVIAPLLLRANKHLVARASARKVRPAPVLQMAVRSATLSARLTARMFAGIRAYAQGPRKLFLSMLLAAIREKLQPCRVSLSPLPQTHVTCAPGRARHAIERGDQKCQEQLREQERDEPSLLKPKLC